MNGTNVARQFSNAKVLARPRNEFSLFAEHQEWGCIAERSLDRADCSNARTRCLLKPNSVPLAGRCTCLMGYEDKGGFCQLCARGFYQPFADQQSCLSCDSTETTGGDLGATARTSCVCLSGYYRGDASAACVPCPYGLDCTTNNYTVTAGFWRAGPAHIACFA